MTASQAISQANEERGLGVVLGERCPGGEVGAHYATDRTGKLLVFKWSDDPKDARFFEAVRERVQILEQRGYPVPRYLAPVVVSGGVLFFQEAVAGAWRDEVGQPLVATALRLVELQADAGREGAEGWTDYIRMTLLDGADGYCLHEPLRRHSSKTSELVEWVESVGAGTGSLPGRDLVHIDFHHRNMLREGDRLCAVVDWEGCRVGDRAFDLVTFCFGMTHAVGDPAVFDAVWERAEEITTPPALCAYTAHMALRRIDWTIRHHPEELDRVLTVVERWRRRLPRSSQDGVG
jgi:hypothetical protein